jgi:plastocyanin
MRRRATVLVVVLAVGGLAGCGGGSKSAEQQVVRTEKGAGAPAPQSLHIAADPGGKPSFDVDELRSLAGTVQIAMTNTSSVPHDIAIKGNGVEKIGKTVTHGRSSVTVTLKPGTYTFYCSVDAHEQQGMKGTLRVGVT